MKLVRRCAALTLMACLAAVPGNSQSLGDVARQEKDKKTTSPSAKRTITNDDIPSVGQDSAAAETSAHEAGTSDKTKPPKSREALAAEFKTKIKAQKQRINLLELNKKGLEKSIDRWKTSDCTHVLKGDGSNVCDRLQVLTLEYDRTKTQLDKARAALNTLQDDARKAGFGVQVYDPE